MHPTPESPREPSPSDAPDAGYRLPNGEWRPPYPARYAPIFVWPPRPRDLVKWALAYPGFLWPWNSVYLAITLATWFWFQPPVEECATFRPDWICQMLVRNLVLLWIVYGGWHLILYTFRLQGDDRRYDSRPFKTRSKNFLFGDQVFDNVFWTSTSGCLVWTGYEVMMMWGYANGLLPYVDWREHPIYCALWLCVIPFWREFHFYWIHRMSHLRFLYRHVHYLQKL